MANEKILTLLDRGQLSASELVELSALPRYAVDEGLEKLIALGSVAVAQQEPITRYRLVSSREVVLASIRGRDLSVPELVEVTTLSRDVIEAAVESLHEAGELCVVRQDAPIRYAEPGSPDSTGESHSSVANWCASEIQARGGGGFSAKLAELVNRRGIFSANRRLGTKALREVADHLFASGFVLTPDYRGVQRSPGVNAVVMVSLADSNENSGEPASELGSAMVSAEKDDTASLMAKDSYFRLGVALAQSDGQVDGDDLQALQKFAKGHVDGLHGADARDLRASVELLREQSIDVVAVAKEVNEALGPLERRFLVGDLLEIAFADGVFHRREEEFIRELADHLGLADDAFETLVSHAQYCASYGGSEDDEEEPAPTSGPEGLATSADQELGSVRSEVSYLFTLLSGQSQAR